MSDFRCPTCGCPVKVPGRTTMHYEPIPSPAVARLVKACRRAQKRMNRCGVVMSVEDVAALDAIFAALAAVEAEMKEEK